MTYSNNVEAIKKLILPLGGDMLSYLQGAFFILYIVEKDVHLYTNPMKTRFVEHIFDHRT